jgi:GNAT superfamily N-acetyltransferase
MTARLASRGTEGRQSVCDHVVRDFWPRGKLAVVVGACLLLAVSNDDPLGYLLGFRHITFYPNGPVASVKEVLVRNEHRGRGVGRALMEAFEQWAAGRIVVGSRIRTPILVVPPLLAP